MKRSQKLQKRESNICPRCSGDQKIYKHLVFIVSSQPNSQLSQEISEATQFCLLNYRRPWNDYRDHIHLDIDLIVQPTIKECIDEYCTMYNIDFNDAESWEGSKFAKLSAVFLMRTKIRDWKYVLDNIVGDGISARNMDNLIDSAAEHTDSHLAIDMGGPKPFVTLWGSRSCEEF